MIATINAEIKSTGARGFAGMNAELYDTDIFVDDLLASAIVQVDGKVQFLLETEDASSDDSPLEKHPDVYLVVKDQQKNVVFRSSVLKNVAFDARDPVSGDRKSTLDLVFSEAPVA